MEDEFLDLGFVDQSFLNDITQPETEETKKENIEISEKTETSEPKEEPKEVTEETEVKTETQEVVENPDETGAKGSPNLSSSIAEALVDEGVLQTLDKERLEKIKTTDDLIEAFREDLRNQLNDEQKRVSDALKYGIEPTKIQYYEQWIKTLEDVTDETLENEDEKAENYRKNLIYQNYVSKGFDENDALEMVNRSVESGKDIDDAKKALSSLKKYYQKAYDDEVSTAKKEYEKHVAAQKKQFEELKSSIMDDKENFFEQFELPKSARQKVFDAVAKPSISAGKDDNGKEVKITALQKFIKDDPNKANKIIGTLYVLTDGFTKFENIMKGTVKKQVRKSVENLERALNNSKPIDGSMKFKSGIGEDSSNLKILDFDFD